MGLTLLVIIVLSIIGTVGVYKYIGNKRFINELRDNNNKYLDYLNIESFWIQNLQCSRRIVEFFRKNDYHTIAIYGMNDLGQMLYKELEGSEIEVKYGIDKRGNTKSIPIYYTPDQELESVDIVVIAALHYYNEIEPLIRDKMKCDVIGLDEVVFETYVG